MLELWKCTMKHANQSTKGGWDSLSIATLREGTGSLFDSTNDLNFRVIADRFKGVPSSRDVVNQARHGH